MIVPGEVISYIEMCREERVSLQRGMNFRLKGGASVLLMSLRRGAPFADRIEENGRTLIYEGHDQPRRPGGPDPKKTNQPRFTPGGRPTENGLFFDAAQRAKRGETPAEVVRVYEKIKTGIWAFNGIFHLVDAWEQESRGRSVFKFKLRLTQDSEATREKRQSDDASRVMIPSEIKLEVWKRDKGRCRICESGENLHFDHIIPRSRGGSSDVAANIQILCAKHNLAKRDKIE